MSNDGTLSRIQLSHEAAKRWQVAAPIFAAEAIRRGIQLEEVSDEQARIESDGCLTIFVRLPDGAELSMRVEPHEWKWLFPKGRNH